MPTLHIKVRMGNTEIEIKADGELNKETLMALKNILQPFAGHITTPQNSPSSVGDPARQYGEPMEDRTSIYTKFKETIMSAFRYGQWFTSIDAREAYYDLHGVLLKSSTTITYLRRMEKEGILISKKQGKMVKFRLAQIMEPEPQKQRIVIDPF